MKPVKILYVCDPERASNCEKSDCAYNPSSEHGECCLTFDPERAMRDENGCAMIALPATLELFKDDILFEVPASVPYKYTAVIEKNSIFAMAALVLGFVNLVVMAVLLSG